MTEILVGTKKGLFVLEGDVGSGFEVKARAFPGQAVEYAMRDPRSGRYLASVTSWFYGGRIWGTDDPAGEWEEASGVALPEGGLLWLCFNPYKTALKAEIVKAKPQQIVFLNSCFTGSNADEQLTNLELELQQHDIKLTVI